MIFHNSKTRKQIQYNKDLQNILSNKEFDWSKVVVYHENNFFTLLSQLIQHSCLSGISELLSRLDKHGNTIFHTIGSITTSSTDWFLNFRRLNISEFKEYLNIKNLGDETPLHVATFFNNKSVVRSLVELKVDGSSVDSRNLTALDIATWLNFTDCIDILKDLKTSRLTVTDAAVPIYQWGQMLNPFLSLVNVNSPTRIFFNHKEHSPTNIKFGQNFAVMLTDTGLVYSWGLSSYGKLGLSTKTDIAIPTPVITLKNKQIISIACGKHHSLALDEIGIVYGWGNGICLGFGNDPVEIPRILPFFVAEKIVSISCGQEFSLALTDSGVVYSWGKGIHGNLGYHAGATSQMTPRQIKMIPPISQISAGNWHTMVLSKRGDVYTFGSNDQCRLGRKGEGGHDPMQVSLPQKIKKIGAGAAFNAVLSEGNVVYTWGSNSKGQLGLLLAGNNNYTHEPQVVNTLLTFPINTIEVGYEHVMVLTDGGEVITFGDNSQSQCGVGDLIKEVCGFRRVQIPDNSTVFKIAAGGNSSLVSLSSGHNIYGAELASLLTDETFVDLRLISGGNLNEYVNCHRAVVACRVPKLAQLLTKEIESPNSKNSIEVTQTYKITSKTIDNIIYIDFSLTSLASLKLFIKFIYTDHIPIIQNYVNEIGIISTGLGVERLSFLCNIGKIKSLESIPSSNLAEDFKKLADPAFAKPFYDITFRVHDPYDGGNISDVNSFKVLLCLRSSYFKMMLAGSFVENSMKSINMYDVAAKSLHHLLYYFYCNEVPSDPNDCIDLVVLADFHQISRAKDLCSAVIRPSIDNSSLLHIYQLSQEFNLKTLIIWCESRISQISKAWTLEGYERLSEDQQKFVRRNCADPDSYTELLTTLSVSADDSSSINIDNLTYDNNNNMLSTNDNNNDNNNNNNNNNNSNNNGKKSFIKKFFDF